MTTFEVNLDTLIATIVAAIIIGFFWRIFNIPDKYMSKKECQRRRDGDGEAIKAITTAVTAVHSRVDEIYQHLIGNNTAGK